MLHKLQTFLEIVLDFNFKEDIDILFNVIPKDLQTLYWQKY